MPVETVQTETNAEPLSDLDSPIWSVISFERVEALGLQYADAAKFMNELETRGIPGLCIVTDEAASRIKTQV